MVRINDKEFAERVDDKIATEVYKMLVRLMTGFEHDGLLRELNGMEEEAIEYDTWDEAENLKETVYEACVRLGLAVEGDGRDF